MSMDKSGALETGDQTGSNKNHIKNRIPIRSIIRLVAFLLIPVLILPLAGRWDWFGAWVLIILSVGFGLGGRLMAFRRYPGLMQERGRSMNAEGTKAWDRNLAPIVALFGPLLIMTVAALDKRWGWTLSAGVGTLTPGILLALTGYGLATWAMLSNPFFSGTVRIQRDREHAVMDQGPYGWIRHPGYAGALLAHLGTPLLLDSWWAYIPAIMTAAVLILRTELEDRTLWEELDGYAGYAARVKYRLMPSLW